MSQGSWGSRTAGVGPRSRARWVRCGVMTVALLGLAVGLVWALAQPFYHPRAQLVLIAGDIAGIPSAPKGIPADYTLEDLRGMLALENALFHGPAAPNRPLVLGGLHQPDQMRQLAGQLQSRVTGRGDVLII